MKKIKKIGWIPILMGLSQLLLTGFVMYWLVGQFKNEKDSLRKVMHYEFIEAQNQALDSTLHLMLSPLIKDSLSPIGWVSSSSTIDTFQFKSGEHPGDHLSDRVIKLDIRDSSKFPSSGKATYEITAIPHQEAVLRGVKMIIRMSEDSIQKAGTESFSSVLDIDSVMLLDIAAGRLRELDHSDFNVYWYQDSLNEFTNDSNKKILFRSALSEPAMVFEINNYEPFLIKKIIPQILFGLLLLVLTASAFIITYRSLRKQILLNTIRNEFVSNVSHELKTPVSTVKVALESLQNYDLKKDAAVSDEYLKMASLEMDRLDLLIQKILNQSLLDSGQVVVNMEAGDLVKLTKNVILSLNPRIQEVQGSIDLFVEESEVFVNMDDLYIQGVVINLLDNAIKYGGNPPKIEMKISKGMDGISLSVLDNGDGIAEEYREKIFERFFRVPTGDKHNVKGYGLGLSFAAQVMEQHGGSIKLDNKSSEGSLFIISFPANNGN